MNKVDLHGRLYKDPDTRYGNSTTVTHFGLAVDRKIKKKDVAPMLSYDARIQKQMEDELAAEE